MDLDGFEPSTSSMPFKKYQSLTDTSTRNKRLSKTRFGRQWTPPGPLLTVWTPVGLQDATPEWHVACFRARLLAGLFVFSARRQQLGSL